jgi:hypothetical protein
MELSYRDSRQVLTVRLGLEGGPRALKSGNTGWYQVGVIPWLHGCQLRAQWSLTRGQVAGWAPAEAGVVYEEGGVRVLAGGDKAWAELTIPDFVQELTNCWGASAGATAWLGGYEYHSQLLVKVVPGHGVVLRRDGKRLVFVQEGVGRNVELGGLTDRLADPHEALRNLLERGRQRG